MWALGPVAVTAKGDLRDPATPGRPTELLGN